MSLTVVACYRSAFAVALPANHPSVAAARNAVLAASLSTRGEGARGALPAAGDLRALMIR